MSRTVRHAFRVQDRASGPLLRLAAALEADRLQADGRHDGEPPFDNDQEREDWILARMEEMRHERDADADAR